MLLCFIGLHTLSNDFLLYEKWTFLRIFWLIIYNCGRQPLVYARLLYDNQVSREARNAAQACSQEIVRCPTIGSSKLILLWSRVELQECVFHELIDFHNGCLVTTSVAIVRSWEDSDDIAIMRPIVTIHYELMCSGDELKVIGMVELFRNVLTKRITSTTRWDTPAASVIRVWPEEIADRTFVRYFHETIKLSDLVQSINAWRKTTM
jgi:hypothetical protein